ncbi:phytanoyl-CoA dioxygenase family protein [Aspergillus sclerotioniger CBS 115572]|uniref:Phytanoyl-CoA dioxygenase family protein n=1 Tax=Aspergillus sclerotioniger CBS 115572 TaxID=1450535 RepID=A0A317XFC8_9EURO|nr:phytanoyl-CoA dioxygenase family protein [Aspergillus sclerotioniger CBS 115572]PWY96522.1 phytanoyl-CoA dioxygenase family protein [Aspergillus sclerotioniger CBS 115572]
MPGLTPEQLTSFNQNGYLVLPNYLTPTEITACLTETHHLLDTFPLDTHPLTQFTTGDDPSTTSKHVGDDYFLTSGDKVRFFFEPDAFAPSDPTNPPTLTKPKHLAVNKIGHSLHSLSAPFRAISLSQKNADIARSLGFKDPRVLQSMVICKQPGIGGAVPSHRDSEFLYTNPPSAVGWWFALQDAGSGNASLGMYKGSQREGIKRRFVRVGGGNGTGFEGNEGARVPVGVEESEEVGENQGKEEDLEILDVKAGSLVLIHGNVLHKSERNTGDRSRFAYTFHVIEGAEGWKYDERNWLQPTGEGFSRLFQ